VAPAGVAWQVVGVDTQAVQRHRSTVVECVKDADVSIRRRALELVYALVNEGNITALTRELLDYLRVCDPDFKADLTNKLCMLVQRFAPDKRWYIDSMLQVWARAWQRPRVQSALPTCVLTARGMRRCMPRMLLGGRVCSNRWTAFGRGHLHLAPGPASDHGDAWMRLVTCWHARCDAWVAIVPLVRVCVPVMSQRPAPWPHGCSALPAARQARCAAQIVLLTGPVSPRRSWSRQART
jgi:Adaptin N terminal region